MCDHKDEVANLLALPMWQLTLLSKIAHDIANHGLAPAGSLIAWKLGLAVYNESMQQGATYPHHREGG